MLGHYGQERGLLICLSICIPHFMHANVEHSTADPEKPGTMERVTWRHLASITWSGKQKISLFALFCSTNVLVGLRKVLDVGPRKCHEGMLEMSDEGREETDEEQTNMGIITVDMWGPFSRNCLWTISVWCWNMVHEWSYVRGILRACEKIARKQVFWPLFLPNMRCYWYELWCPSKML